MLLGLKTPSAAAAVSLPLLRNSCCLGNSNAGQVELRGRVEEKEYNCSLFFLICKLQKRNSEHLPEWTDGILTTPHAVIHFQELKAVAQNNSWKSKTQVNKLPEHILLLH